MTIWFCCRNENFGFYCSNENLVLLQYREFDPTVFYFTDTPNVTLQHRRVSFASRIIALLCGTYPGCVHPNSCRRSSPGENLTIRTTRHTCAALIILILISPTSEGWKLSQPCRNFNDTIDPFCLCRTRNN